MSYRTPWTSRQQQSVLTSDRLRPPASQARSQSTNSKGSAKGKGKETPKSAQVLSLEELIAGLQNNKGKRDTHGGCFCHARVHELSSYTPLCTKCGLVLCSLNLPYRICPHCNSALLSDIERETLISKLQDEVADTIAKEIEAAERALQEARQAEGSFPTLGASHSGPGSVSVPQGPHKVLSLNSKTKKVTVASYGGTPSRTSSKASTPNVSRPASRAGEENPIVRVPAPAKEPEYVKDKGSDGRSPWTNLFREATGESLKYIPPPSQNKPNRDRRRGKGKDKTVTEGEKQEDVAKIASETGDKPS